MASSPNNQPSGALLPDELLVIEQLSEAFDRFTNLDHRAAKEDADDFARAMRTATGIIMARAAKRAHPEFFTQVCDRFV